MSPIQSRQEGYVLAVTLWVTVAILISATIFASRVERTLQAATAYRDMVDIEVEMTSARATLLHRLATTALSETGLGVAGTPEAVRFDDHRYVSGPLTEFSVQDTRGLVNLNTTDTATLVALLAEFGIGATEANRLADTLADYVDDDSLRRLNGAEAPEYLAANMPPPRNAPLLGIGELVRVFGWRDHPDLLADPRFLELIVAGDTSGLNPNTAKVGVLRTLPGMTPEGARAIVTMRDTAPFVSAGQFAQLIGADATYSMTRLSSFPSTQLRVTQYARGRHWALRYTLELLPTGDSAPWQLRAAARITDAADETTARTEPSDQAIVTGPRRPIP